VYFTVRDYGRYIECSILWEFPQGEWAGYFQYLLAKASFPRSHIFIRGKYRNTAPLRIAMVTRPCPYNMAGDKLEFIYSASALFILTIIKY